MTEGGSYVIDPTTGERTRVEEPTRSAPAGDMPRTADGQMIGLDGLPMASPAEPAPPVDEPTPAEETPAGPGFPFGAGGLTPVEGED